MWENRRVSFWDFRELLYNCTRFLSILGKFPPNWKLIFDVLRARTPKKSPYPRWSPKKTQTMIVSHIFFTLFFRFAFEEEWPKMFFYFKIVNSFQISSEESSGRAESNNVAPVSWIQKGQKPEGGPLLAELFHTWRLTTHGSETPVSVLLYLYSTVAYYKYSTYSIAIIQYNTGTTVRTRTVIIHRKTNVYRYSYCMYYTRSNVQALLVLY